MAPAAPKTVYILNGRDDFLRRQARRRILRDLFGDAPPDLAVATFDASAEAAAVLDELRTAPLLSGRRVAVVNDADRFVATHAELLSKVLAGGTTTGVLVLVVDAWPVKPPAARDETDESAPRRRTGRKGPAGPKAALKALAGIVEKVGEVIDCAPPPERALPRWIAGAAKARGKRIAPEAARLLAEWIGADLARLDGEVEKLALFVGDRADIEAEDVAAAVAAVAREVPFALVNAIRAGQTGEALKALDAMMTARGLEFRVLATLAWFCRGELNPKPGRYGQRRSRRVGPERTCRDLRRLLAADVALKTGAEPLATMQRLVTRLCL